MKKIEAYQSADGRIFVDERQAIAADDDVIGQEFDELIHRIMCMDPGHSAMFRAVVIVSVLEYGDDPE